MHAGVDADADHDRGERRRDRADSRGYRSAASAVVHNVPAASGGSTATSARGLRNVSTKITDASTTESTPLFCRSPFIIASVCFAMT